MNFFLPKQVIFFDLLEQLNTHLIAMVDLFLEFSNNFENFESYVKKADEIEGHADSKAHEIIDKLNKSFITPFDREDIYELTSELDDIIDLTENAIHNIYLYQIGKKPAALEDFAKLMKQAAGVLSELLGFLVKMKYTEKLLKAKVKMHELEDRGDELFTSSIRALFARERDAIALIKEKDILESLEEVMDKFQKVGDVIEGIIVKSS